MQSDPAKGSAAAFDVVAISGGDALDPAHDKCVHIVIIFLCALQ